MPLSLSYLNMLLYKLDCQFVKKFNIKFREFQLTLQMIAVEINLTITMIYLQLKTKIMHYKNFSKQIFWHSNGQRKTATVIHHLLNGPRQPTTMWPKAPDFAL